MARSWTEVWSVGSGQSRRYCGIARTQEGYAVDVFEGDTCLESEVHATRKDAVERALAMAPAETSPARPALDQSIFRNLVTRPTSTHSTTKMFPS